MIAPAAPYVRWSKFAAGIKSVLAKPQRRQAAKKNSRRLPLLCGFVDATEKMW